MGLPANTNLEALTVDLPARMSPSDSIGWAARVVHRCPARSRRVDRGASPPARPAPEHSTPLPGEPTMKRRIALAAVTAGRAAPRRRARGAAPAPHRPPTASSRFVYLSDLEPTCFDAAAYKNLASCNVIREDIVDPLVRPGRRPGTLYPGLARRVGLERRTARCGRSRCATTITVPRRRAAQRRGGAGELRPASVADGSTLRAPRAGTGSCAGDRRPRRGSSPSRSRPRTSCSGCSNPDYPGARRSRRFETFDDGDRCADPLALVGHRTCSSRSSTTRGRS